MTLVLNGSEEALIVCRKIFQNYHHGLKLVMERTGEKEFTIPGRQSKTLSASLTT